MTTETELFNPAEFAPRFHPVTGKRDRYIKADSLKSDWTNGINLVTLTGTLVASRLSTLIEGEELKQADEAAPRFNRRPVGRPYCYLKLENPVILPQSGNPNALTINELYTWERFYEGDETDADGNVIGQKLFASYTHKGNKVPEMWRHKTPEELAVDNTNVIIKDALVPGNELMAGIPVVVQLRVYPTRHGNCGQAVHKICVQEQSYRYRPQTTANNTNLDVNMLAQHSLAFAHTITPETQPQTVHPVAPVVAQPQTPVAPVTTPTLPQQPQVAQPVAQPQPQGVPQPQVAQPQAVVPTGSPFQSTPAPAVEDSLPFAGQPVASEEAITLDNPFDVANQTPAVRPITFTPQEQ